MTDVREVIRKVIWPYGGRASTDRAYEQADSILQALKSNGLTVVNEEEYRALCEIRDSPPRDEIYRGALASHRLERAGHGYVQPCDREPVRDRPPVALRGPDYGHDEV